MSARKRFKAGSVSVRGGCGVSGFRPLDHSCGEKMVPGEFWGRV